MTTTTETSGSATNTQSPVSIRGALSGLRAILLEQVQEHQRGLQRAQQGLRFVEQIESTLGFETAPVAPTPAAAPAPTPAPAAPTANGNGHGKGRSVKVQEILSKLSPQKSKLVKLLDKKGDGFSTKETIAEKLELSDPNQVGALVSGLRADGVEVETAATLRKEGHDIPEGVQGYRLAAEFRSA